MSAAEDDRAGRDDSSERHIKALDSGRRRQ